MDTSRFILIVLGLLSISVAFFAARYGKALDSVFTDKVSITDAQPIEHFSRARAGEAVRIQPAAVAVVYEVKRGDSWASIARSHRIDDYNELARHFEFAQLRPGMKLTIPAHLMEAQ